MKFVTRHRSDILAALEQHGISETEVDFVKKRGRINIIHRISAQQFSYLRKKETRLDPFTQQWNNCEWYKIKTESSKERDVENWDMVIQAFKKWCSKL